MHLKIRECILFFAKCAAFIFSHHKYSSILQQVYSFAEMGSSVDRRCGFGNLKDVHCLQRAGNLLVYSLVLGLIFLGVTASYSYMSAVQTTTSTVFSFSATDIGIWYAAFEVGSVLANIGASYFLTHKHIPNVSRLLQFSILHF